MQRREQQQGFDLSTPGDERFRLQGRILFGLLAIGLLVGGVGYWATATTISGAVIASGSVKVMNEVKQIQHRDGGIVAAIMVERGQAVHEGDVLLRLDDAQTRAELAIITGQLGELTAREARLVAERDGLPDIEFPAGSEPTPRMIGETKLFLGNLLSRNRHKEQLTMQEAQIAEEVAGLNASLEAVTRQLTIAEEQQATTRTLIEKGLAKRSDAYAVDSQVASLLGERGELVASVARARSRIGEVQLEKLAIDESARNDAQKELRMVEANIGELNERRDAVNDRLSRTDIRAPIAGVVNELSVTTLGGVITPAQTLATIVPADADLKVEVKLRTVDVDQISLGQPARLRFSAFNQRTTPEVPGVIIRVAAAAQYDDTTGEAFYVADVSFEAGRDLISGLELRPGMPVEVFVETMHMSPATYLLKPFTDQLNRAFREE